MRIAEDELIERIRRRIPSQEGGLLRIGIGHDAAVIRPRGRDWVITCDQFLEGVHFLADKHPPDSVGYKALARATSDVVAMAARTAAFSAESCIARQTNRALAGGHAVRHGSSEQTFRVETRGRRYRANR